MEQNVKDRTGMSSDEFYVERIEEKQLEKHEILYTVKWEGYSENENTYENLDNLLKSLESVKEYEKNRLAELRLQNSNYDFNHRERNKLPVDRCPNYVHGLKEALLQDVILGDVFIQRVLGMTTVKNKRHFFIECDNKKVLMVTDEDVERLPQTEQSKLWDFMIETKGKAARKMRQEVLKSIAGDDDDVIN